MRRRLRVRSSLRLFREQPLREVDALAQVADLATGLLNFGQEILAQHLQLFLHPGSVAVTWAYPLRECADQREQQHRRSNDRQDQKKHDFFGHGYLAGGSRSASRCFATRRSRKSTRSPSSLICSFQCRISSTSRRSSLTSSAVSSSSSAAFLPRMRAANAFPIGERESRASVPPPNSRMTATRPTTLSPTTPPRVWARRRARPGARAGAPRNPAAPALHTAPSAGILPYASLWTARSSRAAPPPPRDHPAPHLRAPGRSPNRRSSRRPDCA